MGAIYRHFGLILDLNVVDTEFWRKMFVSSVPLSQHPLFAYVRLRHFTGDEADVIVSLWIRSFGGEILFSSVLLSRRPLFACIRLRHSTSNEADL